MAILSAGAMPADAQRDAPGLPHRTDLTYDGRFTFVRLRWGSDGRFGRRGCWSSAWNHDYPRAVQNLSLILKEISAFDIRTEGSWILSLDDRELFRYPMALMWDPGFWWLTAGESE